MSSVETLDLFRHYRSLRALAHEDMLFCLAFFPLRCWSLFFSDLVGNVLLSLWFLGHTWDLSIYKSPVRHGVWIVLYLISSLSRYLHSLPYIYTPIKPPIIKS